MSTSKYMPTSTPILCSNQTWLYTMPWAISSAWALCSKRSLRHLPVRLVRIRWCSKWVNCYFWCMLFRIDTIDVQTHSPSEDSACYQIILLPSAATFTVDFTDYEHASTALLFLTPYQHLSWKAASLASATRVLFHGDFYCIEFHKKEVA